MLNGRVSFLLGSSFFLSVVAHGEEVSAKKDESTAMSPLVPHPSKNGWGGKFSASYLYWSADEDALEFAMSGIAPTPTTAITEQGKVYVPRHKWDSGFKVGIGLFTPWDGWDLFADYTRFLTSRQRTAFSRTPGTLRKIWQTTVNFTNINQGAASWNLNFNNVDLALGRSYYISTQFSVHPFVGLKGAWQNQGYNVNYDGSPSQTPTPTPQSTNMDQKQQMWAIGVLVGADMYWRFWKPFSLFGKVAASILSEEFRVRRVDTNFQNETDSAPEAEWIAAFATKHVNRASPVLEAVIGLEVEKWAYNDKIRRRWRIRYLRPKKTSCCMHVR